MLHEVIQTIGSRVALRARYDNFIGGQWVAPSDGRYFENISPCLLYTSPSPRD